MSRKGHIDVAGLQKSILDTGGNGKYWGSKEVGYETEHPIRIFPPLDGQPQVWLGHAQHWAGITSKREGFKIGDEKHTITCERIHGDGRCAPCEILDWASANGMVGKSLIADAAYYMGIIVYPGTKQEAVKIWSAKVSIINKLKALIESQHWGGEELFDEKIGHNFDVVRHGIASQLNTIKWDITPHPRPTPISIKDWEDQAPKLSEVIIHIPYAEQVVACRENLATLFPVDEIFGTGRARAARPPAATKKKKTTKKG
jgi:hypothetical protein